MNGALAIERETGLPAGELWVYGYGSLMWRPDFPFLEAASARLHGYHRRLCVWSWFHRGNPRQPGLVLGLDLGGCCIGRAYRVAAADRPAVLETLHAREMVTPVYRPRAARFHLEDRRVEGLVFTVDRGHPQYAGKLAPARAARTVAGARGESGANPDYLAQAVAHFSELGIHDAHLSAVQALLVEQPCR